MFTDKIISDLQDQSINTRQIYSANYKES